ncbi:MAG: hypothetical protein LBF71_02665 [Campylobacteraceae bacterium]|jgi:chromosome segregation ATPase|nr:hypothetical protein [Campylobacteraceae bacterium]
MKDLNLKSEFEQMLSLFENENKDEILSYIKERIEFFLLFDLDNPYKKNGENLPKEQLNSYKKQIVELQEDINYNRESIRKLQNENETLTKKLEKQSANKEENDLLKKQVESLKEKIKDIDARYNAAVNKREKEISGIIDKRAKKFARMDSVNSAEIAALKKENRELKNELSAIKTKNDELLKRCELIANDPFKETNESLINNRIQEIEKAYKATIANQQKDINYYIRELKYKQASIDNYVIKLREMESKNKTQKTEKASVRLGADSGDELLDTLKLTTKIVEKYKNETEEWKKRFERIAKQTGGTAYIVDGQYYSLPKGEI